ncbi:MAG: hypothetical protein ABIG37_03635 [Nanoarchaeota archaeon]|nr:hypothetical protein [Nanoarchaeota archaeon]
MQKEVPVIELPIVPIKNYDDIKDPKEKEMMQRLDFLSAQNKIMQAHQEFHQPKLFGQTSSFG